MGTRTSVYLVAYLFSLLGMTCLSVVSVSVSWRFFGGRLFSFLPHYFLASSTRKSKTVVTSLQFPKYRLRLSSQFIGSCCLHFSTVRNLKMASTSVSPSASSTPSNNPPGASRTAKSKKGKYSGRGARDRYREDLVNNQAVKLPQKRFFRQRAHANPFSDHQLD